MSAFLRARLARRRCPSCLARHAPAPPAPAEPPRLCIEARGDLGRVTLSVSGGSSAEQETATLRLLQLGADATGPLSFVLEGQSAARFLTHEAEVLADGFSVRMPPLGPLLSPHPVVARALITAGTERVGVKLSCASGLEPVDPPDLLQALGEGREVVRLEDGSYARMGRASSLEPLGGPLREAWEKGLSLGHTDAQRLVAALSPLGDIHVEPNSQALFSRLARAPGERAPKALQVTLRPYQLDGVDVLRFWHDLGSGGVFADQMGLGKTGSTIALLASVKQDTGRIKACIVAPTSVVFNWAAEFIKFCPSIRVHTWEGINRQKHLAEAQNAEVLLTSYGLLRRDEAFLSGLGLDYLILDEAQAIKNPSSSTGQAAKRIRVAHRLAITGTPVENRLTEFWSLFDFTSPGLLGTLGTFEAAIRSAQGGDNTAIARLRQLVGPFLLRRLKSDVLTDLPERNLIDLVSPLAERQQALYDETLARTRLEFSGLLSGQGAPVSKLHVLAAITRLRQLACDARLAGAPGTWAHDDSGKLMALRELLEQCKEGGHKVLIFSQFTSMLALLRDVLEKDGFPYEYLDGSTPNRATRVAHFQDDPKVLAFLISLKAGGTGLNLTAADTVIHFDPWWNPAVEAQATDRAHRIGQKRSVTVYRMLSKGTIEQRISALKARKARLANNVLADGASAADDLSADDIRDLLR